jgi:hypothetical protein
MESAFVTLILVTLILFGALTIADSYFTTQDALMVAQQEMEERTLERTGTVLALVGTEIQNNGALVAITLKNTGNTKVADFEQWDLIVQYYTAADIYRTSWLPYRATMVGDNQWTVAGIYLAEDGATPEVYEPAILNPGEAIVLQVKLLPEIGTGTMNLATIGLPNGFSQSVIFVSE